MTVPISIGTISPVKKNGNGSLKTLALRVDRRFARIEREIIDLRRESKVFFDHVVTLDEEFRTHRRDKTAHFVPAR